MSPEPASPGVLLVFLDGVGLGPEDPSRNAMVEHMPRLTAWLGMPPTRQGAGRQGRAGVLIGLDATLGVPGTPQSGTGQASLLTGHNAARLHGRHFGPWVPTRLRPLVREQSILSRARAAGLSIAFANAYPRDAVESATDDGGPLFMRAGPPLAALGAGVLTRHAEALREEDAVATEIVNDGWRNHLGRSDVPQIDEARAARNLLSIAAAHRLTLFAHYSTDSAGHRRDFETAAHAVSRVDRFLGALLDALPANLLLIVTSDHGNIEDCTAGHTLNPALGLVAGAWNRGVDLPASLVDVAGFVLSTLGVGSLNSSRSTTL